MNAEEINALPERLRKYVHALETECDPAGTIRENFRLREENATLRFECERLSRERYLWVEPVPAYDPEATKRRAQEALDAMEQAAQGEGHACTDGFSKPAIGGKDW